MQFTHTLLVLSMLVTETFCQSSGDRRSSYIEQYKSAVESYISERWFQCASQIQHAVNDRKLYCEHLANCGRRCRPDGFYDDGLDDSTYVLLATEFSRCLEKCRCEKYGEQMVPELQENFTEIETAFKKRDPYDYLQMCAFKVSSSTQPFIIRTYNYL